MPRRIVSLWFPRLPAERIQRGPGWRSAAAEAPFALIARQGNAERLYDVNVAAGAAGLTRGMGLAEARAQCPGLRTAPADPRADARFLRLLARWAGRYCPWVGVEGDDAGLLLDITGAAHLMGGEAALLDDLTRRLARAGLTARAGLADTVGAAWALARFAPGIAARGETERAIAGLPVAALRLDPQVCDRLQRLGVASVADLAALPRAPLTRRFGPDPLRRLDQALGRVGEQVSPLAEPPRLSVRLTLPEPIGLTRDVAAGLARLLDQLCARLERQGLGARVLVLTLRRVDHAAPRVELRLARPLRDPVRIAPLFDRGIDGVDAGFGIDQLRLEAAEVAPLLPEQIGGPHPARGGGGGLDDLVSRMGARIGLDNIRRFLPADSHIPERSFQVVPAAYSAPAAFFPAPRPRPLRLFPPEPVNGPGVGGVAAGRAPPARFRWRRMALSVGRAIGPERIAPEWWLDDPQWRSGLRDYWMVETRQGRRLWMYHTPQAPGWFVQGEFA